MVQTFAVSSIADLYKQYLHTNAIRGFYVKQIAMAMRAYRITTYFLLLESTQRIETKDPQAYGVIVELSKDDSRSNKDLPAKVTALGAYSFSSRGGANVIQEQGKVRIEPEERIRSVLEVDATIPNRGKLDVVLAIVGNGSALYGTCMAFEQTGTRAFVADMVFENGVNVCKNGLAYSGKNKTGGWYSSGSVIDAPMGALLGSVFTSPSMPTALLYVDNRSAELALESYLSNITLRAGPMTLRL